MCLAVPLIFSIELKHKRGMDLTLIQSLALIEQIETFDVLIGQTYLTPKEVTTICSVQLLTRIREV